MTRVLVGKRNGKRIINWPGVLLVGLIVATVSGLSGGFTWFLLTGEFSPAAVAVPTILFVWTMLGMGIRSGFAAPLEQLTDLK